MEKNIISIIKKSAEMQKTIEIKGDIIVPDTKPDIVNIIGTNSNQYIYKEDCQDGKYKFEGNVDAHIIYLSDNGETKCIQTTLDFMDYIEDSKIKENMFTKYTIEITNIETRILNERKISVTIQLKICFSFFENNEIEFLDGFDSLENVEKLQETVELKSLVASNSIKTSLKEDISIDEIDEITDILKTDIQVVNIENKISYNKVLSKADVEIKVLYMTVEQSIKIATAKVPIMNFIDIEKVTDDDECEIDYKVRNMLFKTNSKEMRSIACQIDFEVSCEVSKKKEITIVQDMYGIGKNISFTQKPVEIQTDNCNKEVVNINENILVEDIRNLFDVDCRANIVNKIQNGNFCNYEGEVCLGFYYETGNNLGVKQVKIPFMVKLEGDASEVEINFTKKQFRLNNEDVNCDVEMEIQPNNSNYKTINIIDNIEESEWVDENNYAMVVYFVKQGDTIWNIARNFRIPMNEIRKINNLGETDNVKVGEKLYIMR